MLERIVEPGGRRPAGVTVASARILVVDDDPNVSDVVGRYLEREGYAVTLSGDGEQALRLALESLPDLIVLDLMLPGLDGIEVYRRVREVALIPVIMLTARGEESDRVEGLDLGADDYVAKPFSPRELVARVGAVLRRSGAAGARAEGTDDVSILRAGDVVVDVRAHEVHVRGALVTLTAREFDLLEFLLRRPRQAFSREVLLERVWGYTYGDASTVTVHVRRLREKIEADPSAPTHLRTVWGVGYRFDGAPAVP